MNEEKSRKQFIIVKSLIVKDKNQVLFVKRDWKTHKEAHGKWEFPGGKIEFGEHPEATAIRETKEESGYDVSVDYLLPKILSSKWVSSEREGHQILICYVCKFLGGELVLPSHGVSEIKWIDIDKAPKDSECLPGTIDFLEFYKTGRGE